MNCVAGCGNQDVPVYKTLDDGFAVSRIRWCQCGARWKTEETSSKGTLSMAPRPVITDRRRSPAVTNDSGDRRQSPVVANDSSTADTPKLSIENHGSRTEAQATALCAPPLGDPPSGSFSLLPESGPSLSNPRDLQFHEHGSAVCAYCGVRQNQSPWGFEVDHFVPRSAGGVPWGANMVPACHTCNQIKKHRMFASLEDARQHIHHTLWRTNRAKYRKARELCFGGRQPTGDPPPSVRVTPDHPGFDVFWTAYPRRVARPTAKKAWDKATPPLDRVLAALAWQCLTDQWRKDGGQFVPHPSAYINQRRWEDERPRGPSSGPSKPIDPLAVYCDWHREAINARKPSRFPRPGCPDCKHAAAASQKRESEPQSLFEIGGGK